MELSTVFFLLVFYDKIYQKKNFIANSIGIYRQKQSICIYFNQNYKRRTQIAIMVKLGTIYENYSC